MPHDLQTNLHGRKKYIGEERLKIGKSHPPFRGIFSTVRLLRELKSI